MKKILFAVLFALLAPLALAQETPDALIKQVTDEVLDIVRKDKDLQNGNTKRAVELIEARVLPHFNFQRMTALALGKEWRKANPQQQKQLVAEFRNLLVRTYSNALSGYKNQKINFKPFKMNPGDPDALVRTEIAQPGGKPIAVDYTLEKFDDGWKVVDVSVAAVSLVTNYREQFGQEVRNSGIDGLIESLANRNKSLDGGLAKADKK